MIDASAESEPIAHPKWEDILGNGKLLKQTLEVGDGKRPNMGNRVSVTYKVFPFETGDDDFTQLLSKDPPFKKNDSFFLGDGDANLHALELGVALMNVGEKAVIKCSNPKLGFEGEPPEFRPDNIPPNSNLFIFVELLRDEGAPLPWLQRPRTERLQCGRNKIERGNAYCRAGIFASSINAFSAALRIVGYTNDAEEGDEQEEDNAEAEIRQKAYCGLSAAHFNTTSYDNALKCCEDALKIDPTLVKVVFRRGRCLAQLGQLEEAKEAMLTAKTMSQEKPDELTTDFVQFMDKELARIRSLLLKDKKQEAELYRKMIPVKPLPPSNKYFKKFLSYKLGILVSILVVSFCLFLMIIFNHA